MRRLVSGTKKGGVSRMVELKPCPFCGGEAELTVSGNWKYGAYIIVRCMDCRASGKGEYFRGIDPYDESLCPLEDSKGGTAAIRAWNRRVGE